MLNVIKVINVCFFVWRKNGIGICNMFCNVYLIGYFLCKVILEKNYDWILEGGGVELFWKIIICNVFVVLLKY